MSNCKVSALLWLFALLVGTSSSTANAAPEAGWYWNPAESGRGFFIESQNGVTFIGAYLYEPDGHAVWYVAGGKNADPYNYTGPLYNMSKGQTLYGPYIQPVGPNTVGTITVHFTDDTHGTVTWPGGTVEIQRQIFGTGPADFQPYSGWWWNADQSGSGYSIEVQGKNLFLVGFMYDDDGRPIWYFSAGPMTTPTTYHGNVLQFADGQTMQGTYHPPSTPSTVATLDVVFTGVTQATLAFTKATPSKEGASPKQGEQSLRVVVPEFVFPPLQELPPGWTGSIALEGTVDVAVESAMEHHHYTLTLNPAIFLRKDNAGGAYSLDLTNASISFEYAATQTTIAGVCVGQESAVTNPPVPVGEFQATLDVSESGLYTIAMNVNVPEQVEVTCPRVAPQTVPYPVVFELPPRGGGIFGDIEGAEIAIQSVPNGSFSGRLDWKLIPCDPASTVIRRCVPTP